MSSSDPLFSPDPSDPAPGEQPAEGSPVPPMYLIGESEGEDILHPVHATAWRIGAPPGTPGFASILFRQEDYTEPGDENWEYGGLIPLVPAAPAYDEGVAPEDLDALRAGETDEWDYPPAFPCPRCRTRKAEALPETLTADSCLYACGGCEALMILELRPHIRNAAVLFLHRRNP